MTTQLQMLIEARDLIQNKDSWTQFASGRNKRGEKVLYSSPAAVQWCAAGAILKVTPDYATAKKLMRLLDPEFKRSFDLSDFNDGHAHSTVLRLFTKAIAKKER